MTIYVGIDEAEKRLSELMAAAVGGEDVVLVEDGRALVRFEPVGPVAGSPRDLAGAGPLASRPARG